MIELFRSVRAATKRRNVSLETVKTDYTDSPRSGEEQRCPDQTKTRSAPNGAEEPNQRSAGQALHSVATVEDDTSAKKAYAHDNLSDDATRVSVRAS